MCKCMFLVCFTESQTDDEQGRYYTQLAKGFLSAKERHCVFFLENQLKDFLCLTMLSFHDAYLYMKD